MTQRENTKISKWVILFNIQFMMKPVIAKGIRIPKAILDLQRYCLEMEILRAGGVTEWT